MKTFDATRGLNKVNGAKNKYVRDEEKARVSPPGKNTDPPWVNLLAEL